MIRYALAAVLATLAAACADPMPMPTDAGAGGMGGTGGAGGSEPVDSGQRVCFLNVDCPTSWVPADGCHTVRCDPTGHETSPGAPMLGCYLAPCSLGDACQRSDGKGTCIQVADAILCGP